MQVLKRVSAETRRRVLFRVYLGYARGVGATTSLLDECRRRSARGTDVVVAAHRVHGDPDNALRDLEVLGAARHRHAEKRLDLDAVLARNPDVVCIDDLAAADEDVALAQISAVKLAPPEAADRTALTLVTGAASGETRSA